MKEVKLYSSRQPSLLQQMDTFLMVKVPRCIAKAQTELVNTLCRLDPSSLYICFML